MDLRGRVVRSGVLIVVVLAASLGAWLLGRSSARREDDRHPSEARQIGERIDRIGERLARLEHGAARNQPQPRSPGPGQPLAPAAPEGEPEVDAEPDPELEREEARVRADLRVAAIEEHFGSEEVDPTWASEARHVIEMAAASPELGGSRVSAVLCKATLCRVEVEHESEIDAEAWASIFYGQAVALPRGFQRRLPSSDGVERTVLYLAREGHRIPSARRKAP